MSDVIITVRGEHHTEVAAEIAVANVAVRLDGDDRSDVFARASALADALREELRQYESAGAVERFSSERVSIWADRPWSQTGEQLPLVHHASVGTRAEFRDFGALSEWVSAVSAREGLAVDGIEWRLTDSTERATGAAVAEGAVQVAVDRASAYAKALGLGAVTPLEIADVGLLSAQPTTEAAAPKMMRAMASDAAGGSGIEFEPRTIVVSSAVEARFVAR